jgi:hypothetical protein
LAWLHAIPEGKKLSRLKSISNAYEEDERLLFPDLEEAAYLISMLHEVGITSSNGMSVLPVSWQEIDAWARVTQSSSTLWERMLMKELSEAYVAELHQATAIDRPDPYVPEMPKEVDREAVVSKLHNFFRSMKKKSPEEE